MESVAHHLHSETSARWRTADADWFGRSTFNRYYYATFLEVRTALGGLDKNWKSIAHATIPSLLEGAITKELKKGNQIARRANDSETLAACSAGLTAARELARLMREAYATRVTADYEIEIRIEFASNHDFALNKIDVSAARHWPQRAKAFGSSLTFAWKQIHV